VKVDEKVREEVERQVGGLMSDHGDRIQKAFDLNGQKLELSFKVEIKKDDLVMEVDTNISYLPVPKVKDSASGRVAPLPLFDAVKENPHDRRTRLHTLWMIQGGEIPKGKFENYLKKAV
jgi:hypothetical protein